MRLLHVINSLVSAGAEKLIVDMVIRLDARGYENDILILNATETHLMRKLKSYPNIHVLKPKSITNVYDLRHIGRIAKHIKQYDIVHVHLFPALYWTAIASIFSRHKGLIYTEHSTDNNRRNNFIYRLLDRFMYRRYHQIVGISEVASENLRVHLGGSHSNIQTIENGIDLEQIASAEPYVKTEIGIQENDILIIQVSGFIPPKDQKTVIRSLTHLAEHIKLILVGDGPQRASCEELVNS